MCRNKLTDEDRREIERVARARAELPTDVELARRVQVSRRRIQQIMKAARDAAVGAAPLLVQHVTESATIDA